MRKVVQFRDYHPKPRPAPYPPLDRPATVMILPVVRIERGPPQQPRKRKDA